MIKAAIEKILEMAKPNEIELGGTKYIDKRLYAISAPRPEALEFKSLKGLCDTLKAELMASEERTIVRVTSASRVDVYTSPYGNDNQRTYLYSCKAQLPVHEFGRFISLESMIIALRSKYVRTGILDEHVQLLGSIFEESSVATLDDGISQSAVVKKGVALKANRTINPIVRLAPYRTFSEVEQPSSDFLFRLKEGGMAALFEADGGAWEIEARHNIAEFLRANLSPMKYVIVAE